MSQYIKQGDIFGRVGTGLGKGLAEQVPKEMERNRLSSGLEKLGRQKGLTPFQQFAGAVGVAHEYPQIVQSAENFLRQQSIIDSVKNNQQQQKQQPIGEYRPTNELNQGPKSATRPESTEAALNPHIPPSGAEQENMARQRMVAEPHVYRTIDEARQSIANEIAGDVQQSNAKLGKRKLEQEVQNDTEEKLSDEIGTLGAQVPGTVTSRLQQQAVDDVRTGKLSVDAAKVKYGEEADKLSKVFSNINSWGNMGLIQNSAKDILQSIESVRKSAKEGGVRKEAAESMIAKNGITPQLAYASMYPVKEIKSLNEELKSLPNITPRLERIPGIPGPGLSFSRPNNANAKQLTTDIAPSLARSMGLEGSPLSIAYELEQKGYDPNVWKKYLIDNEDTLNLTSHQKDELQKPQPSFFGLLNDWFLKSFSGLK